jgi:hypothetical protein
MFNQCDNMKKRFEKYIEKNKNKILSQGSSSNELSRPGGIERNMISNS